MIVGTAHLRRRVELGRTRLELAALFACGLAVSVAAGATLAHPRAERPAIVASVGLVVAAALLLAPLFPLLLALIATEPFADWKPPGSHLSISVVLAIALSFRCLVELPRLRPFESRLVVRWLGLPLLLLPSAFIGPTSTGQRAQFFLSTASWYLIALLIAHFVDEERWRRVRLLLVGELVVALAVGAAEVAVHRWLVPFPNPPDIESEYFFGFFRPRSIALTPYGLGEFLAFTAPLVWYELGAALRGGRARSVAGWLCLAAGQLALLVATLSRKSLLQVAVAAVVFLALSLRDRSVRGRILAVAAVVGAVGVLAVYVNGAALSVRLTSSTSAESVATRVDTLRDAIHIGVQHMPLGAGIENFVTTSPDRYGEQLAAYNSYAESFSDSGFLGLFAAVALVLVPFAAAVRVRVPASPPAAVVVPALAGLMALALVESSIWRKSLGFAAGLCFALFVNGRGSRQAPR